MITGKTKSGFQYVINEKSLQDVRLLDAVKLADSKDPLEANRGVLRCFDLLIGTENREKLIDHLAEIDEDGIPTLDAFQKELVEILNDSGEKNKKVKNS